MSGMAAGRCSQVVEDQQEVAGAEVAAQHLGERSPALLAQPQRRRDGGQHQGGIGERGEDGEGRAVGVGGGVVGGDRQREAGLADAAGADQGDESRAVAQERAERGAFGVAADEGGRQGGQGRAVGR